MFSLHPQFIPQVAVTNGLDALEHVSLLLCSSATILHDTKEPSLNSLPCLISDARVFPLCFGRHHFLPVPCHEKPRRLIIFTPPPGIPRCGPVPLCYHGGCHRG